MTGTSGWLAVVKEGSEPLVFLKGLDLFDRMSVNLSSCSIMYQKSYRIIAYSLLCFNTVVGGKLFEQIPSKLQ